MERLVKNDKFIKFHQGMKDYFEYRKSAPVQAFINSIAFPKSVDDLLYYMKKDVKLLDPEWLIFESETVWSVPRWCKKDDIVLFMVTVTSRQAVSHIRSELKEKKEKIGCSDYRLAKYGLMKEESLYKNFGGKIYAIGRVKGKIIKYPDDWRVYASIGDVVLLDNPISYDQFKNTVPVSKGGSITPVYSDKYTYLKNKISEENHIPKYILKSHSTPIRETNINKHNWIDVAKNYRFHYTLEEQFRKAFVDYLLKELSDNKKIFSECYCKKGSSKHGYIDNVILFNGKYLPVEVKLDTDLETDLIDQVSKYCFLSSLTLSNSITISEPMDMVYEGKVIIIDTFGIYLYCDSAREYEKIYDFFSLSCKEDIIDIKKVISNSLITSGKKQVRSFRLTQASIDVRDSEVISMNGNYQYSLNTDEKVERIQNSIEDKKQTHIPINDYERYLTSELDPEEALTEINRYEKEFDGINHSDIKKRF